MEKPSSESRDSKDGVCTGCRNIRIVTNNPSQGSNHPDDHFQAMYVTPGFKPFSYLDFEYKMKINALILESLKDWEKLTWLLHQGSELLDFSTMLSQLQFCEKKIIIAFNISANIFDNYYWYIFTPVFQIPHQWYLNIHVHTE